MSERKAWWELRGDFPLSGADIVRLRKDASMLFNAARFSLSVHKEQGLYDQSERMAYRKLEIAIEKASA